MYRQFTKKSYRTKGRYTNNSKAYNGRTYDSIREANHAEELDFRKEDGLLSEIIPQYKIELKVNDRFICNYYVDFKVTLIDGSIEFHEVKKSWFGETFLFKWRIFEAVVNDIEPGAELLIIN